VISSWPRRAVSANHQPAMTPALRCACRHGPGPSRGDNPISGCNFDRLAARTDSLWRRRKIYDALAALRATRYINLGQTGAMSSPASERGIIRLPLSALALGSGVVALASLGTLITVVAIKDVDALSTVALALAIIAFVVQLIVFVFQGIEANRQSHDNQELHSRLMTVVSQIEERTQGTQKSLDNMNDRLLEALIGKASNEGLPPDSPEFAQVVTDGLSLNDASFRTTQPITHSGYPPPFEPDLARRIHHELETWPRPDELSEIRATLKDLSDSAIGKLAAYARDLLNNTEETNRFVGPGLTGSDSEEGVKQGLVEKIPGWSVYTLTPEGRRVGRVFTAIGEPPEGIDDLLAMRDDVDEARAIRRSTRVRGP
jgi:hypothetical protein